MSTSGLIRMPPRKPVWPCRLVTRLPAQKLLSLHRPIALLPLWLALKVRILLCSQARSAKPPSAPQWLPLKPPSSLLSWAKLL